MQLAPIILFAYNRPKHLAKTIDALKKNRYADKSDIYIFSDGPKSDQDAENVRKVREIINSLSGFNKIIVKLQKENIGLKEAILNGVTEVLNERRTAIVLEDDIITAPFFLEYMNSALDFSEKRDDILSVTGFNYPIKIPANYKYDYFLLYRASSLGWGTQKEVWDEFRNFNPDYSKFFSSKKMQADFNSAGEDLTPMLKSQVFDNIKSWVILWTFFHFQNNGYCLYPTKSLLAHIGDDVGTHKINTKKINSDFDPLVRLTLDFKQNISKNDDIEKEVQRLFKLSFYRKIINIFKFNLYRVASKKNVTIRYTRYIKINSNHSDKKTVK